MLRANTEKENRLLCLRSNSSENPITINLDKDKILVGRCPHADLSLPQNKQLSWYHALIVLENDSSARIIDLASDNGTFINGRAVKDQFFGPGDVIKIGHTDFFVEEIMAPVSVDSQDKDFVEITNHDWQNQFQESYSADQIKGLTLIDGEYCDITFKENYRPLNHVPIDHLNFSQYVDYEEAKKTDNIAIASSNKAVEVSVLSMGNIISVDYFELKNRTYNISAYGNKKNTMVLEVLDSEEDKPFLKVHNGKIHLFNINGMQSMNLKTKEKDLFHDSEIISIENDDVISFVWQSVQVIIKVVDAPSKLKKAPFWSMDKQFQKEAFPAFSVMMSLMLLLLLVDITPPTPPEKKVAVIFKRAPKVQEAKNPTANAPVDDNKGVKDHHKPDKKIEMAKKSDPAPAKKVEVAKPAPPKPAAYEFKSSAMSALFNNKATKQAKVEKTSRSIASTSSFNPNTGAASAALKTTAGSGVSTLGQDRSGDAANSSGAKGLVSKDGVDTTYVEPKTVVLGSIDPELLRKILQEYIPQFRHCYQQELAANEAIQGVVDLNFRIDKSGKVAKVDIKAKAKFSARGTGCMANVLKIIDFPKPKGGGFVDVRQPLNFFSEQSKI